MRAADRFFRHLRRDEPEQAERALRAALNAGHCDLVDYEWWWRAHPAAAEQQMSEPQMFAELREACHAAAAPSEPALRMLPLLLELERRHREAAALDDDLRAYNSDLHLIAFTGAPGFYGILRITLDEEVFVQAGYLSDLRQWLENQKKEET